VTDYASLIRDVERRASRGAAESEWFEQWREEFDAVAADGDEEACRLLADILIAFDRWQRVDDPDPRAGDDS
jgi:hypothetical protein